MVKAEMLEHVWCLWLKQRDCSKSSVYGVYGWSKNYSKYSVCGWSRVKSKVSMAEAETTAGISIAEFRNR